MNLSELALKDSYSSDEDDIVNEFYNPVLECATRYDRITGYFSPSILAIASRGFAGIIKNAGKIRIITSIKINTDTLNAIRMSNSTELEDVIFSSINFDLNQLKRELERDYLRVFAHLYKNGQLEMKVAILDKHPGILHQKIGIVRDRMDNAISFSGSNNETPGGTINNIEEFKVFKNWSPANPTYFADDQSKFEKYWNNKVRGIKIVNIGAAIKSQLIHIIRPGEDIKPTLKRIRESEQANIQPVKKETKPSISPRDYQIEAINHWTQNNYCSIFEMATGTGKTFTAINGLIQFKKDKGYIRAVIVVPLATLTIQWMEEIQSLISDTPIINTSTNDKWETELDSLILSNKLSEENDFILITTYSMFSKKNFNKRVLEFGENMVLLADEMHNLVNANRIRALKASVFKYRLGLSATPTRLWQQRESIIAREYFGDNEYTFSLEDAIKNGFLVEYNYHPLPIKLTADEYDQYTELSREISRMQHKADSDQKSIALQMKLIRRARIKKNAGNKLVLLENCLKSLQDQDILYDALIYVDNEDFLQELQNMLTSNDIRTTKFTGSNTVEERLSAIKNLRTHSINAIVAIKCLDEGVDIPSAKLAFFLSNNTDPREYVQRLGRVLRLSKNKEMADVYDYIVTPPSGVVYNDEPDRKIARNMVKNELIRVKFFNGLATNSQQAQSVIDDAVDEYRFYFEEDELTYSMEGRDNGLTD